MDTGYYVVKIGNQFFMNEAFLALCYVEQPASLERMEYYLFSKAEAEDMLKKVSDSGWYIWFALDKAEMKAVYFNANNTMVYLPSGA